MKQLTQKQLTSLASKILASQPYKEEFDNKYYRTIAKKMLIDAMKLALEAAQDEPKETTE